MDFIEHIIEPTKLLLAWQSPSEMHHTRYIVAELNRVNDEISLIYLINTKDFQTAKQYGFEPYPAFQDTTKTYHDVLDAFMRRLPPRTRGDFTKYLENFRIKPSALLSDFALLGYTGAKLPSDGFSIIHPFNDIDVACELLLEASGFRHIKKEEGTGVKLNAPAHFSTEVNNVTQEAAIRITAADEHIGYVNRGLVPTFIHWMNSKRVSEAWIEKANGSPGKPAVYLYVKISPKAN